MKVTKQSNKIYAGVDLHKKYSYITFMDEKGDILKQGRFENNETKIFTAIDKFTTDGMDVTAVVESTYGWYWLADEFENRNIKFKLAHPKKINAIVGSKKTDKEDSKAMANLLRTDLLPESYIPIKEDRLLKEMLRFRMRLVHQRSTIKQQIRDLLAKQNIQVSFTDILGNKADIWLRGSKMHEQYKAEIIAFLDIAASVQEKIDEFTKLLDGRFEVNENAKLLKTIPGFGKILSLTVAVEVGDISRFKSDRSLASYAGVVPTVKSSGDKTHFGRSNKNSNRYIRWALAEGVYHLIRKDKAINEFYEKMKDRKGTGKSRMAVMNKMIRIVYAVLSKQVKYEPRSLSSSSNK